MRVHITQQHNSFDSNWIQIWTAGVMPHNWLKSLIGYMYFTRVLFLILKYRLSQFSYISKLIIWDKCKISLFVDRDMFQSYRPKKAPFSPLLTLHKKFHQEFFTRCKINKKWFKKELGMGFSWFKLINHFFSVYHVAISTFEYVTVTDGWHSLHPW